MFFTNKVTHNPRLLFWGRVLVEAKTLSAVIVMFYLHRDVNLNQVFYLSIVWSLTSLATEVPSGYLADHIGRKRTILLGVILLFVSQFLMFFAHGFWQFVLSFIFLSSSFSCFSGTEEALLYESLKEMGQEREMNTRNGKLLSARSLPDIFLPVIGAFVAKDLLESQFQILMTANMMMTIIAFLIFCSLTEPQHIQEVKKQETGIFAQSIKTICGEPWLLKVAFNKLLVFIAVFIAWRMTQPLLSQYGFGVEMLGIFYVIFQGLEFCASWFAGWIECRVKTAHLITTSTMAIMTLLTLAMISPHPWIVFFSFAIGLPLYGLRDPVFSRAVNKRIQSKSRATTLSNLNVIKGVLDIPFLFLAGWLSTFSLLYPLVLSVCLCFIALIFFPIRSRELES
ncbi:TPA: hypothetical protein DEP34_03460 [Candidatus Uhrbacteria bacterium]|uniref:Major facilitator superfamily n=2 Tax=Candidatus Uhriibacteriota TaxID=1752732 RepID=A0A0G1Q8H9_9BACT|nr:MAG: Major facilitator superfamily [Candidatus Uhrbacteria bacterium GW2011_GWF2_46_218]KKU41304.1 MAG: Major facilitator superfamily [Candidatus Uhrbacteria bacterium GW2011_GWE2_46_68]HBK33742.1 hypothetical protein [Candidatus Uhrbacteria bacterium]HCB19417.1 hypothetical protein [Candidatus Uhrbacteria bacterium]